MIGESPPRRILYFTHSLYETSQSLNSMFRPDLLKNKRILITGGGTGLGKGMAQRFLELGAIVHICGRREEVLEETAAELSPKGTIHPIPCDVRNLDAVEAMIDSIWSEGRARHSRQ